MRNGRMRVAMALAVSCAIGLGVTLSVGTLSAAPAPALGAPQTRVEDAYAAMGWANRGFGDGAQARETLLIKTSKGSMMQWDPGQSQSVSNLMVPDWGKSTFTQVWDRSRAATRTQWVRPRAGGGTRNYTEILTEEGSLAPKESLRVAREVASGLQVIHRNDIIHRDLKPANILLESDSRRARLLDYGMAKYIQSTAMLTRPGDLLGESDRTGERLHLLHDARPNARARKTSIASETSGNASQAARALPRHRLAQDDVRREQVHVGKGRALVQHLLSLRNWIRRHGILYGI